MLRIGMNNGRDLGELLPSYISECELLDFISYDMGIGLSSIKMVTISMGDGYFLVIVLLFVGKYLYHRISSSVFNSWCRDKALDIFI